MVTSTLDQHELSTLADRMLRDYDAVDPGSIYADGFRLNLDDAWRVQTAVTRLREARGEKVIGYKVGAVSQVNQQMMGLLHPVWGRLWDTELHDNGVDLKKSDYANIAIEAEFGIRLNRDVRPGMSMEELAACVEAVYPLLELHNLVLRGDAPHGHELIANNCIVSGVVHGAPVTELTTPITTDLELVYDGIVQDSWDALLWPSDLLAAVSWLAKSLAEHGLAMTPGQLILTSAWGPPIAVAEHTHVEVKSSAFGTATANFR